MDSQPMLAPAPPQLDSQLAPAAGNAKRTPWKWPSLQDIRETFFGPVFMRDVRVAARTRSTYVTRGGFVLLVLGALAIAYAISVATDRYSNRSLAASLQQLQTLTPVLTLTLLWVCLIVFPLLAASDVGGIAQDRRRGTVAALATTPLTPASVLLSGMMARLVQLLLLMGAIMPAAITLSAFGGIEQSTLFRFALLIVFTTVLGGACGALASTFGKGAKGGMNGVGFLLLMCFYPAIGSAIFAFFAWIFGLTAPSWMGALAIGSPLFGSQLVDNSSGVGGFFPSWLLYVHLACSAVLSVLLVAGGAWRYRTAVLAAVGGTQDVVFRTRDKPKTGAGGKALFVPAVKAGAKANTDANAGRGAQAESASESEASLAAATIAPGAGIEASTELSDSAAAKSSSKRTKRPSRTVGEDAVLWRSLQAIHPFKTARGIIPGLVVAAVMTMTYSSGSNVHAGLLSVLSMGGVVAVMVLAMVATAAAIEPEIQSRMLPLLLTSRVSPREFLEAKFKTALVWTWPLFAALIIQTFISALFGATSILITLPVFLFMIAAALPAAAAGAVGAVLCRRTGTAGGMAVLLLLIVYAGPWALLGLAKWLEQVGYGFDRLEGIMNIAADGLVLINPIAMCASHLSGMERSLSSFTARGPTFRFSFLSWVLVSFAPLLFSLLLTWLWMRLATGSFNRLVMRRLV